MKIAPRRSARNTGEQFEEVLLAVKKRKKRRTSTEDAGDTEGDGSASSPVVVEEASEMSAEEARELQEAQDLKPSFKMGKNEWYKILDVLEQYVLLKQLIR